MQGNAMYSARFLRVNQPFFSYQLYCKTGFARGLKERFHKKERGSKEKGLLKTKKFV